MPSDLTPSTPHRPTNHTVQEGHQRCHPHGTGCTHQPPSHANNNPTPTRGIPLTPPTLREPTRTLARRTLQHPPQNKPKPPTPTLILLTGPPLSGKTTLAQHLQRTHPHGILIIENDALRPHAANTLHNGPPRFTNEETNATYHLAHILAHDALQQGHHVLHDATNTNPHHRQQAKNTAQTAQARTLTLHIHTPLTTRTQRAHRQGHHALQAHQALKHAPPPDEPDTITLDGTQPPHEHAQTLLQHPLLSTSPTPED